jgi:hypothetical protein
VELGRLTVDGAREAGSIPSVPKTRERAESISRLTPGPRHGESLGLGCYDIDLHATTIHMARSMQRSGGRCVLKDPYQAPRRWSCYGCRPEKTSLLSLEPAECGSGVFGQLLTREVHDRDVVFPFNRDLTRLPFLEDRLVASNMDAHDQETRWHLRLFDESGVHEDKIHHALMQGHKYRRHP